MQKEQFDITGMTCSACSTRVEKSVAKLPGITLKDGRTLEDVYQASIQQKRERDDAFLRRASDLTDEYDRLHQGVEQQEKQ